MESKRLIYTIGHLPSLDINSFLLYLKRYGVNCVVDIRPSVYLTGSKFGEKDLRTILKQNNIYYLGFQNEFNFAGQDIMRRGKKVYEKIIIRENFVRGIERLKNGIEKGYTIVILGRFIDPYECERTIYISRYLYEGLDWQVFHILGNGNILAHKSLLDNVEKRKVYRAAKNKQSSDLGKNGEEIAAAYLINHGFSILDRNWNLHRGCELDIVAYKNNMLHVIEVKTRMYKEGEEVHPEFAVDYRKMKNILKGIYAYRAKNGFYNIGYQIDCVAIVIKTINDFELNYYENLRLHL